MATRTCIQRCFRMMANAGVRKPDAWDKPEAAADAVDVWVQTFERSTDEQLEGAVRAFLASPGSQFWPLPGRIEELRSAAARAAAPPPQQRPLASRHALAGWLTTQLLMDLRELARTDPAEADAISAQWREGPSTAWAARIEGVLKARWSGSEDVMHWAVWVSPPRGIDRGAIDTALHIAGRRWRGSAASAVERAA